MDRNQKQISSLRNVKMLSVTLTTRNGIQRKNVRVMIIFPCQGVKSDAFRLRQGFSRKKSTFFGGNVTAKAKTNTEEIN
jgi:hypothetical protein